MNLKKVRIFTTAACLILWLEMDPNGLVRYLANRVDSLKPCRYGCLFTAYLEPSLETQTILQACGHTTEELDQAIVKARDSFKELTKAHECAIDKFKQSTVYFIVDAAKAAEIESTRLL